MALENCLHHARAVTQAKGPTQSWPFSSRKDRLHERWGSVLRLDMDASALVWPWKPSAGTHSSREPGRNGVVSIGRLESRR